MVLLYISIFLQTFDLRKLHRFCWESNPGKSTRLPLFFQDSWVCKPYRFAANAEVTPANKDTIMQTIRTNPTTFFIDLVIREFPPLFH